MTSPTLAELQRELAALVIDGQLHAVQDPDEHFSELERLFSVPAGVNLSTRTGVYSNGYPARLREALTEPFPALATILGEGSMASLVERYRPQLPTGWRNLNFIGRELADFLASDRLTEELPFLPDLARLEWCVFECFHARVGAPADLAFAANWEPDDWASARIGFQPGVAVVSSAWPIHDLRAARDLEQSEIDVDLIGRPQSVWVCRQGFEVVTELLDDGEARAAAALVAGTPLGEVMAELESAGADSGSVLEMFARFAARGLIASCRP